MTVWSILIQVADGLNGMRIHVMSIYLSFNQKPTNILLFTGILNPKTFLYQELCLFSLLTHIFRFLYSLYVIDSK